MNEEESDMIPGEENEVECGKSSCVSLKMAYLDLKQSIFQLNDLFKELSEVKKKFIMEQQQKEEVLVRVQSLEAQIKKCNPSSIGNPQSSKDREEFHQASMGQMKLANQELEAERNMEKDKRVQAEQVLLRERKTWATEKATYCSRHRKDEETIKSLQKQLKALEKQKEKLQGPPKPPKRKKATDMVTPAPLSKNNETPKWLLSQDSASTSTSVEKKRVQIQGAKSSRKRDIIAAQFGDAFVPQRETTIDDDEEVPRKKMELALSFFHGLVAMLKDGPIKRFPPEAGDEKSGLKTKDAEEEDMCRRKKSRPVAIQSSRSKETTVEVPRRKSVRFDDEPADSPRVQEVTIERTIHTLLDALVDGVVEELGEEKEVEDNAVIVGKRRKAHQSSPRKALFMSPPGSIEESIDSVLASTKEDPSCPEEEEKRLLVIDEPEPQEDKTEETPAVSVTTHTEVETTHTEEKVVKKRGRPKRKLDTVEGDSVGEPAPRKRKNSNSEMVPKRRSKDYLVAQTEKVNAVPMGGISVADARTQQLLLVLEQKRTNFIRKNQTDAIPRPGTSEKATKGSVADFGESAGAVLSRRRSGKSVTSTLQQTVARVLDEFTKRDRNMDPGSRVDAFLATVNSEEEGVSAERVGEAVSRYFETGISPPIERFAIISKNVDRIRNGDDFEWVLVQSELKILQFLTELARRPGMKDLLSVVLDHLSTLLFSPGRKDDKFYKAWSRMVSALCRLADESLRLYRVLNGIFGSAHSSNLITESLLQIGAISPREIRDFLLSDDFLKSPQSTLLVRHITRLPLVRRESFFVVLDAIIGLRNRDRLLERKESVLSDFTMHIVEARQFGIGDGMEPLLDDSLQLSEGFQRVLQRSAQLFRLCSAENQAQRMDYLIREAESHANNRKTIGAILFLLRKMLTETELKSKEWEIRLARVLADVAENFKTDPKVMFVVSKAKNLYEPIWSLARFRE